jgi:hypothetical protein
MTAHLKVSNHVIESLMGDRVFLHDRSNGNYFSLDAAGTMIWKHIKAGTAMEDIPPILARKYGEDIDRIKHDLCHLLSALFTNNILQGM